MPILQVTLPDGSEVTHELTDAVISVGRISDNMVQIEDASVSSHHAELTQNGADYILKDLGSTNGTRLDGNPVAPDEEHPLHPGQTIRFGSIQVRYLSEAGDLQQPLPAEHEPTLPVSSTSVPPADFTNASPFAKKKKERDAAGMAVLALGILVVLGAGGVIYLITQMAPPSL